MASLLSLRRNFAALAFTQIAPDILKKAGVDESLRRIIYVTRAFDAYHRARIILNPELEIASDTPDQIVAEGCGSIDYSLTWMLIRRPTHITVHGYSWEPFQQGLERVTLQFGPTISFIPQHEADHLEGLSALSFPERFVDFSTLPREQYLHSGAFVGRTLGEALERVRDYAGDTWIVPENGRLIYVNGNHEYKGDVLV